MAVIGGDGDDARGEAAQPESIEGYASLRRELIGVERAAILGLRNEGTLRQETMRRSSVTWIWRKRGCRGDLRYAWF